MMTNTVTPTEALLQVAKSSPSAPAVCTGSATWSYAALWARVRELSKQIDQLDQTGAPIGLHMGLEIDYVAAAHAVWLSGHTTVVLSPKWSPAIMQSILKRTNVHLILYGNVVPSADISVPSFCTFDFVSVSPPSSCPPPPSSEAVHMVPIICSVTPTSGSTGVPKSIVYPMRKSLSVLDEESSTLLKPRDGQWLRGGTTFLRPLFEIRRFMFNETTLYLDPAISVQDQCESFCNELQNTSSSQPLRVHFTPSVFRAFVDFVKMKYGPTHSFSRLYWMVIGGESLSVSDLAMAKKVFPQATLACNYACSEVGFAGVCQMFVRPDEPIPQLVNFNATQGCEDLVLLDDNMSIIPKAEGASGIIGIITESSATCYMGNDEATKYMFRPWGGDRILLYTDDIGHMAADGRISINGRRSRNVKINGLFVDMDHVENALTGAFDSDVLAYKLVKSGEKIVLFWTGESSNMEVLKSAREALRKKLGDNLAMVVSSTRHIAEMPYNASYKVDLAKLQSIADEDQSAATEEVSEAPRSRFHEVVEEIAQEVARLAQSSQPVPVDVPLTLVGLNSITVIQLHFWLQEHYDYDDDMSRLFEEDCSAKALASDILGEYSDLSSIMESSLFESSASEVDLEDEVNKVAVAVAAEVARLGKSSEPVPIDVPLTLAGLNSITVIQLHFWLQAQYDYEEDMSRLFEEDVTAQVVARDIMVATEASESSSTSSSEVSESVPIISITPESPRKHKPAALDLLGPMDAGWSNMVYGMLALALLTPTPTVPSSPRRPALRLNLAGSGNKADIHTPTLSAVCSPWIPEALSPGRMLCV